MKVPALAVFIVSTFTSHLYGSFGLARRLGVRGSRVEYWGEPSARRAVERQGFVFRELQPIHECYGDLLTLAVPRHWQSTGAIGVTARSHGPRDLRDSVVSFEHRLDDLLARHAPELIVLHPLVAAYIPLLRKRALRCVVLQDKPLPASDPLVPPPTSGMIPADTRARRLLIGARWMQERLIVETWQRSCACFGLFGLYTPERLVSFVQKHSGAHGRAATTRRVAYDLHFADVPEWVLCAPEADFPRANALPRNIRYVGPCVDLDRVQERAPVERAPTAEFVVYVSMGCSLPRWSADLRLLETLIAAFEPLPGIQLIVSCGNLRVSTKLRDVGRNVRIFPFVPQLNVLGIADLAITHAGANTYRECIATRTPMLAFPRDYDQAGNAARIVYLGLGLRGRRRLDSAATIRSKALRVLRDSAFSGSIHALDQAIRRSEERLLDAALADVMSARSA